MSKQEHQEWLRLKHEAYQEWLEDKRKIDKEDELLYPYEPRDREEFINKHELNGEKD